MISRIIHIFSIFLLIFFISSTTAQSNNGRPFEDIQEQINDIQEGINQIDTVSPGIVIEAPSIVYDANVTINLMLRDDTELSHYFIQNGVDTTDQEMIILEPGRSFVSEDVSRSLQNGSNKFLIMAVDRSGNTATSHLEIIYQIQNQDLSIDQSHLPVVFSVIQARDVDYQGQSFSINKTGYLTFVDVLVSRSAVTNDDMELYIVKINDDNKITQVFGPAIVNYNDIPIQGPACCSQNPSDYLSQLTSVNVSSFGINVQIGEKYAFLVHSSVSFLQLEERIDLFAGNPGTYSSGSPWGFGTEFFESNPIGAEWGFRDDFDMIFQTHVE